MFIQYARLIDFLSQVWRPGRILANHYATESVAYTETMTVVTFKVEIDLMHRDANEDVHWLHYGWQDHTCTADSIEEARKLVPSAYACYLGHRLLYKELVKELRRFWRVTPGRFTLPREFVLMQGDLQIVDFAPIIDNMRWRYPVKTRENWPSVLNDEFTSLYSEPQ